MKQLKSALAGTLGPFQNIEILLDRYLCDGLEYQFSVIGATTIENFVPPPFDPNSDEEVDRNNTKVQAEIAAIEVTQARAIREAVLGQPGAVARLQVMDDKIASVRAKLKTKALKQ